MRPSVVMPAVINALALTFGLTVCGEARADTVILSCLGTYRLVPTVPAGKRAIEEKDDNYSVSIKVDIAEKTLAIDDDDPWPITGDASKTVIVTMTKDKGIVTLNRITGSVDFHTFGIRGVQIFSGTASQRRNCFDSAPMENGESSESVSVVYSWLKSLIPGTKAVPGRFESGGDSQRVTDERVFVH